MADTMHIGLQLSSDKPMEKRIMEILGSLPKDESKCSYIRKAVIYYSENRDRSADDGLNDKIDEILRRLDELRSNGIRAGGESGSPDDGEGTGKLSVSADKEIDPLSFEDALGDFLD